MKWWQYQREAEMDPWDRLDRYDRIEGYFILACFLSSCAAWWLS